MQTKVCRICKNHLPLSCYYPNRKMKDGYRAECNECTRDARKEYYNKNKERFKKNQENYYEDHKPADINRKVRYGITSQEFQNMRAAQQDLCAICNLPETTGDGNGGTRTLAIDHCHETSKIRGLLCTKCNTAIGMINHDIELLQKAIEYLEKYEEKEAETQA